MVCAPYIAPLQVLALLVLTVALILLAQKLLRLHREIVALSRVLRISHSLVGPDANRSEGTATSIASSSEKP